MKRLILSITAVAGLALFGFDTRTANAAGPPGFGIHIGGASIHVGHGYGVHRGRGIYHGYPGRAHVVRRSPHVYHGGPHCNPHHRRGHYDWHPTRVIRHGHHFDVIPGHYDFHRSRHYNYRW